MQPGDGSLEIRHILKHIFNEHTIDSINLIRQGITLQMKKFKVFLCISGLCAGHKLYIQVHTKDLGSRTAGDFFRHKARPTTKIQYTGFASKCQRVNKGFLFRSKLEQLLIAVQPFRLNGLPMVCVECVHS